MNTVRRPRSQSGSATLGVLLAFLVASLTFVFEYLTEVPSPIVPLQEQKVYAYLQDNHTGTLIEEEEIRDGLPNANVRPLPMLRP
jgi:cell division protein FtsN